ncbi:MAG: Xaa-Pro peptidase family protein [Gemmatimonadota bacterium]|nr:Xaa-Pro peptidase family protein [Gemmatimonadota bacterium]
MLNAEKLKLIQAALKDAGVDGWLLYDFRGINPIAGGLVGLEGFVTRRFFVFIPASGAPVALTHAIEQGPWRDWPTEWRKQIYSSWKQLESALAEIVGGKNVAMEYSPGDAVPYVDRVPAGVIDLVRAAGAKVTSSANLVSLFYSVWTPAQLESHRNSAEVIAQIARDAFGLAGERSKGANPIDEYELRTWILDLFTKNGLEADHGPIVAIGPNAANPHYEPQPSGSAKIERGCILLIDLFASEKGNVYADQTWMGSLGPVSERDQKVWEAVRDARDAAIELLRKRLGAGKEVTGAEVDDAARNVIDARGFGEFVLHRTGHNIDAMSLHGSGPNIDNLETRDERVLVPGIGFSIEPGVYVAGDVGMRSEVNGFIGNRELIVTPSEYQRDLIIV